MGRDALDDCKERPLTIRPNMHPQLLTTLIPVAARPDCRIASIGVKLNRKLQIDVNKNDMRKQWILVAHSFSEPSGIVAENLVFNLCESWKICLATRPSFPETSGIRRLKCWGD